MAKTLATQRTLKLLRDEGWICAVVEKWLPPRGEMKFGIRIDVWGFGDIIACRARKYKTCPSCFGTGSVAAAKKHWSEECTACHGSGKVIDQEEGIALVQCFPDSGGKAGFDAHREKILAIPEAKIWILAGGKIYLYGWKPKLKSDTAPGNWRWKREEIVIGA